MLGALGVARNDANTCCAQGDARVTKWPIPANSASVELGSVRFAVRAQLVGVMPSKLPASSKVAQARQSKGPEPVQVRDLLSW